MTNTTIIEPITRTRAEELHKLLRDIQHAPDQGLALDRQGFVTGTVKSDAPQAEHILGDFDVHA